MMDITGITSVIFHSFVKKMLCCVRFRNRSAGPCPGPWVWLFGGSVTLLLPNSWPYLSPWLTAFVWGPARISGTPLLLTWVSSAQGPLLLSLSHTGSPLNFLSRSGLRIHLLAVTVLFKNCFSWSGKTDLVLPALWPARVLKAYLACLGGVKEEVGGWKRQDEVKTGV